MDNMDTREVKPAEINKRDLILSALIALACGLFLFVSLVLPQCWVAFAGVAFCGIAAIIFAARSHYLWAVNAVVIAVLALLIILPQFIKIGEKTNAGEALQNAHAIQLALERYATDHNGLYPASIQVIRDDGYMPKLPRNPYAHSHYRNCDQGLNDNQLSELMMVQPLGRETLPDDAPLILSGNVAYFPRETTGPDGQIQYESYILLTFIPRIWTPDWYNGVREYPIVAWMYDSRTGELLGVSNLQ